jgi:cobalt/nickel transport system permease protein
VHVPIGLSNAHLILNGLLGVLLGWAAFPAVFTALLLQVILFQYGGITTLGVNTVIMAAPAVLCAYLFSPWLLKSAGQCRVGSFCCGALSVAGAVLLAALALSYSEEGFLRSAQILCVAHIPIMLADGVVTALIAGFIFKVRPEMLRSRKLNEV